MVMWVARHHDHLGFPLSEGDHHPELEHMEVNAFRPDLAQKLVPCGDLSLGVGIFVIVHEQVVQAYKDIADRIPVQIHAV